MKKGVLALITIALLLTIISSFSYNSAEASTTIGTFETKDDNLLTTTDTQPKYFWASIGRAALGGIVGGAAYDAVKGLAAGSGSTSGSKTYAGMQHTAYACYGIKQTDNSRFEDTAEFAR
ncbi:hypothetical protein [Macrococcus bovicus]|uniref:hypothetical protein n=1 Tax=Macrococcus bovicus TaxID=69968 RepID=UPI0025A639E7|nr:hypothetical protein [Macrococcus bovicus]WJP96772.1 hypothetical protein QSV55_00230 [Macrococcus bovicus]